MSDVIESLASHADVTPELAKTGLGAVISYLKEHFGDDVITKLQGSLPDAHEHVESFQKAQGEGGSGGLVSMVTGLAGKLLGGQIGDITKLIGILSSLGFSAKQVEAFLPKVIELLHKYLPTDMLGRLAALGLGLNEEKKAAE